MMMIIFGCAEKGGGCRGHHSLRLQVEQDTIPKSFKY